MVRERYRLKGAVETLTAEGRMQAWILTGLPPALLLVMLAINASYARLLFDYPKLLLATVGLEVPRLRLHPQDHQLRFLIGGRRCLEKTP